MPLSARGLPITPCTHGHRPVITTPRDHTSREADDAGDAYHQPFSDTDDCADPNDFFCPPPCQSGSHRTHRIDNRASLPRLSMGQ